MLRKKNQETRQFPLLKTTHVRYGRKFHPSGLATATTRLRAVLEDAGWVRSGLDGGLGGGSWVCGGSWWCGGMGTAAGGISAGSRGGCWVRCCGGGRKGGFGSRGCGRRGGFGVRDMVVVQGFVWSIMLNLLLREVEAV